MEKVLKQAVTKKWLIVLKEYEKIKAKTNNRFKTVAELCEAHKIHRSDIRRYYERWISSGKNPDSLLPHKRGSKPGKNKILTKEEERIIMKIRRKFNASQYEISHLIKGQFKVHPSVSTIYRTLKQYPLNEKRKKAIKRYEKAYPGELIHTDSYRIDPTVFVERKKYGIIGFIDDCTRLCYAEVVESATASNASGVFARSVKWFELHGIKIEQLMSDNGSEFTSINKNEKAVYNHTFETTLRLFNVKHKYTRPYRPQTNGKIERFWRIMYDECIYMQTKTLSKEKFEKELKAFLYRYNYQRRHGGLDYKTPLDKLKFIANLLSNS
jgi:transposase InsO family protein